MISGSDMSRMRSNTATGIGNPPTNSREISLEVFDRISLWVDGFNYHRRVPVI